MVSTSCRSNSASTISPRSRSASASGVPGIAGKVGTSTALSSKLSCASAAPMPSPNASANHDIHAPRRPFLPDARAE